MIDIFERLAPAYGKIVRKLAIDTWYNRADVGNFFHKADFFRRKYERELSEHFKNVGYRYSPRRLKDLSRRWLADQMLIPRKLETISQLKKGKLIDDFSDLTEETRAEVMRLYQGAQRPEGKVSPVVSFAENLEARAIQLGEDAAFELGRDMNSDTVRTNSNTYDWNTQEDRQVRPTHRILAGKTFDYNDPPTTIDRYGRKHTGNCGTDWGCRCWETPGTGKPLHGFIARE